MDKTTVNTLPEQRPKPEGALMTMWVIYDKPTDYPHGFVLRAQWPMKDHSIVADAVCWYSHDVEQLRDILPPGCTNLNRQPGDHPTIFEVWMQ